MPTKKDQPNQPRQNPEPDATKISTGDNEYYIKFGTYWMKQFEDEIGHSVGKMRQRMREGDFGFTEMLLLLWAGLNGGDQNLRYSQEEAGAILDEALGNGKQEDFLKEIMSALANAFPEANEPEGRGDTKNNRSGPGTP